jgi:hypothetical protein
VQLGFTEQRLDRAHDRVLAADLDSIADLERLLAAEVAGRDDLVAVAELIAIVDPSHGGSGRYAARSRFAPADDSNLAHGSARIRRMDVEEIIDRLYALPLEEFTRERGQAERELRRGRAAGAGRSGGVEVPRARTSACCQ